MSKKKEITEKEFKEMQEKMLTCGDTIYDAVNGLKLATEKIHKTTEDIEARHSDAINRDNSESAVMEEQKRIATAEINNKLNTYRNKFLRVKNNIEQNLSTLKLLREYEDNIDILDKHLKNNILEDNEYINKIKSQREINNRLAKYYENKNEDLNYYTKYTKYIYYFAIALLTCIVVYVSHKRGFFNYILNLTNIKNIINNRIQQGGGSGDDDIINQIKKSEKQINQLCKNYSFSKFDREEIYKKILTTDQCGDVLKGKLVRFNLKDIISEKLLKHILKNISDQNYLRCREGKTLISEKVNNELKGIISESFNNLKDDNNFEGLNKVNFGEVYKNVLKCLIDTSEEFKELYPIYPLGDSDMYSLGYNEERTENLKKKSLKKIKQKIKLNNSENNSQNSSDVDIKEFYKYGKSYSKKSQSSSSSTGSSSSSTGSSSSSTDSTINKNNDIKLEEKKKKLINSINNLHDKNATLNREIKIIEDKTQSGKPLSKNERQFLKELTERKQKNNSELHRLNTLKKNTENAINKVNENVKKISRETINNPKKMILILAIIIAVPLLLKPILYPLFNLIKTHLLPAPV